MIKFQWMQQLIYHQGASSGDIYNDVYYLYKLYIYIIYLSVCVCLSLSLSLHCHLTEISSQAKAEQVSIAQSDTGTIPQLEWAVTSK